MSVIRLDVTIVMDEADLADAQAAFAFLTAPQRVAKYRRILTTQEGTKITLQRCFHDAPEFQPCEVISNWELPPP